MHTTRRKTRTTQETGSGVVRRTRQRSIIEKVLTEANGPLAPQEILQATHEYFPGLGIATVYRAINKMLADGWLVPVEIPGKAPLYELSGKKHHHHFRCRACQDVFEIEGCPSDLGKLTPKGFKLEDHQVVLYGVCQPCSQSV